MVSLDPRKVESITECLSWDRWAVQVSKGLSNKFSVETQKHSQQQESGEIYEDANIVFQVAGKMERTWISEVFRRLTQRCLVTDRLLTGEAWCPSYLLLHNKPPKLGGLKP